MSDAWTEAAEKAVELRAENERLRKIVDAATDFVLAHCALEHLSNVVGPDTACASPLQDVVIDKHFALEAAILGDANVPGRRKPE